MNELTKYGVNSFTALSYWLEFTHLTKLSTAARTRAEPVWSAGRPLPCGALAMAGSITNNGLSGAVQLGDALACGTATTVAARANTANNVVLTSVPPRW